MRDEKNKRVNKDATRRLSTEEINKKSKNKQTKASSETQIVGKVNANNNAKTKTKKTKKKKFKERHPRIATIIRIFLILIILFIIIVAGIFFGALWGGYNFFDLLGDEYKIDIKDLVVKSENSIIYDADGNEIASLSSGEKRMSVTIDEMSKYLPKAYVAIEDERFYSHSGVDFKRTAAATVNYIIHRGSSKFGGSSITQQVVKNITQDKEDTAMRKVKEMVKALQVEHYLSKDQILELYLNLIFVGGEDVNGVALGAVYYFNKDVKDLSLAECAYMAAINNSPNMYNPFKADDKQQARIELGEKRAKTVLGKMKELGYIDEKEYNEAKAEVDAGLHFENGSTSFSTLVSYQTDAAINEIVNQYAEEKEVSTSVAKLQIYGGGYRIYTSQRTAIQNRVEQEMTNEYYHLVSSGDHPGQDSMAAITIIDPKTGEVVACGAGIGEDKVKTYLGYYNYPTSMLKQTGSSIKPIAVLSAGLENNKLTAASAFYDGETTFPGVYNKNGTLKVFKNEDSYHQRYMTLREAIARSQNIPNLKGISTVGYQTSADFCVKMGILDAANSVGVTLALGALTNGASTLQMAAAYAAISNGGVYVTPTFYTKVEDASGNIIMQPKSVDERSNRVMSEQNAYIVKNVMQGTVSEGTARSYGKIPNQDTSAKTGTTNDNYDRWYVTFTNYYSSACWFGYEYNSEVHWSKTPNPAGTIGSNIMKDIHAELPASTYNRPNGLTNKTICKYSGMIAGPNCTETYEEIFVPGTEPGICDRHTTVKICNETGLLASEYCTNYTEQAKCLMPDTEANGKWTTVYASGLFNAAPTSVCPHVAHNHETVYED